VSLDEFCSSDQWSMLASASEHSKLAAALGGFLITAIALYLKGEVRESVHTLALFSSAVLILVLSAYLSSLITGTVVPDGDRTGICAIAWTQGALSTGMLAAGTTALFGGMGWLLAGHAMAKMAGAQADTGGYGLLVKLGAWLTFAAAMTTTLLLSETSIDYLHFMFSGRPERWLVGVVIVSAAAAIVVALGFIVRRTRTRHLAQVHVHVHSAEPTRTTLGALKFATVGMVVLAITGSWLSLTLPRIPKDWLTAPQPMIVYTVLVLTLAVPALIAVAICYSAPSTDAGQRAISE